MKRGQPEEAERIQRILASPVGETNVQVMRGGDGERTVEIEITGGLTDSMAWDGTDALDVDRRFDVVVRRLARDYAPFDSVTQVDIKAMKSAGVGAVYFEKGESATYTQAELERVRDGVD